jgi:hypothetical protein
MIKQMVMGLIITSMVQFTKANGLMTCNMVKEKKVGKMVLHSKENMLRVKSMELGIMNGMMVLNILETGTKIK